MLCSAFEAIAVQNVNTLSTLGYAHPQHKKPRCEHQLFIISKQKPIDLRERKKTKEVSLFGLVYITEIFNMKLNAFVLLNSMFIKVSRLELI